MDLNILWTPNILSKEFFWTKRIQNSEFFLFSKFSDTNFLWSRICLFIHNKYPCCLQLIVLFELQLSLFNTLYYTILVLHYCSLCLRCDSHSSLSLKFSSLAFWFFGAPNHKPKPKPHYSTINLSCCFLSGQSFVFHPKTEYFPMIIDWFSNISNPFCIEKFLSMNMRDTML